MFGHDGHDSYDSYGVGNEGLEKGSGGDVSLFLPIV